MGIKAWNYRWLNRFVARLNCGYMGFFCFVYVCVGGGGGVGLVSMRASGGVVNEKCDGGGIVRC